MACKGRLHSYQPDIFAVVRSHDSKLESKSKAVLNAMHTHTHAHTCHSAFALATPGLITV
jgi:hypothetical protein